MMPQGGVAAGAGVTTDREGGHRGRSCHRQGWWPPGPKWPPAQGSPGSHLGWVFSSSSCALHRQSSILRCEL